MRREFNFQSTKDLNSESFLIEEDESSVVTFSKTLNFILTKIYSPWIKMENEFSVDSLHTTLEPRLTIFC